MSFELIVLMNVSVVEATEVDALYADVDTRTNCAATVAMVPFYLHK